MARGHFFTFHGINRDVAEEKQNSESSCSCRACVDRAGLATLEAHLVKEYILTEFIPVYFFTYFNEGENSFNGISFHQHLSFLNFSTSDKVPE